MFLFPFCSVIALAEKKWYVANNRDGNLSLDTPDDQYCAHNPMPTTFCQSNIFGVQEYVIAMYSIKMYVFLVL